MRLFALSITALSLVLLTACSDLGYYVQCARGHLAIMQQCRTIEDVVADPQTSAEERARLTSVLEMREFAVTELKLPSNGSYREYADLDRDYVVWNVVAAPEFSLEPKRWCFPVAGCVSYRGYFNREEAEQYAALLSDDGFDVDVYGVRAYSTLNWFDDPVLNTFLQGDDLSVAALIFHELAHQVVYVSGDTGFNEAFAKTVEIEGMRRWVKLSDRPVDWEKYEREYGYSTEFQGFLLGVRDRLASLYQQPLSGNALHAGKAAILDEAKRGYRELKVGWGGFSGFDRWFNRGLNNARLVTISEYHDLVPAFQALLASSGHDMTLFYKRVEGLGQLVPEERLVRLRAYLQPSQALLDSGSDQIERSEGGE